MQSDDDANDNMMMMMIFVIDDDKPWHRQHVTIVKVDIDHFPIHILQLTHLMITGHFRHFFAFCQKKVVFAEKDDFKIHDYEMEGKFDNNEYCMKLKCMITMTDANPPHGFLCRETDQDHGPQQSPELRFRSTSNFCL